MTNFILSKYAAMLVMCLGLFGFSRAQVNLNNGLVLHLPLDGNFNDASGNGHIVSPKNVIFKENCAGEPNKGAYFNGVNSLLEIPPSIALNSTQKLTISFWILTETVTGNETIISRAKDDPSTGKALGYSITLNNNRQAVFNTVTPPGCSTYENSIADNSDIRWRWHSIIAIFDGIQMTLYRDGLWQNAINLPFSSLGFCQADMGLFIGASYPDQAETFKGSLDDIRIYNRAINAEEINSLSSCSFSSSCAAPTDLNVTKLSESIVDVYWKNTGVNYGTEVEYRSSSSFNWLSSVASTTGDHGTIAGLAPGSYEVRIRAHCSNATSRWVTVIYNLSAGPVCQPPTNLTVTNTTENEATVTWDVKPDGIGVNLQYAEKGSGNWIDAGAEIVDKFFNITGLVAGTDYEWRVQTACAAGPGDWVISSFTTLGVAPCRAPVDLLTGDVSGNRALLKWTAYASSGAFEVEYKRADSDNWTRVSRSFPELVAEYIDSLQPVTNYDWRVRQVCGNGTSAWSVSSFSTTNGSPIDPGLVFISDFAYKASNCSTTEFSFSNTSIVKNTALSTLTWDFGDGSSGSAPNQLHRYNKIGNYNVTLTIIDQDGRKSSKSKQIVVTELRLSFAKAGASKIVCTTDPIKLEATGGDKYEWSPCIGLANCNSAAPLLTPGIHDRYVVKVTNSNGCTDTSSVVIKFIDPAKNIFIPNAFTPNNDGINDLFKPLANIGLPGTAECRIFDRFGNIIYSSTEPLAAWDGTYKGKPQPPGSYPYMIKLKGEGTCANKVIKNTVSLIR